MKTSISPGAAPHAVAARVIAAVGCACLLALAGPTAANAQSVEAAGKPVSPQSDIRAQALEIAKIRKLQQSRRPQDALRTTRRALRQFPGNTQLRFLLGVTLSETGQSEKAIDTFEALTRDHPELAEPYNNLAVLHASNGDLDAAHAALIQAIRVVPDYPLALQNLGDVYLRMAERSYLAAVQAKGPTLLLKRKLTRARAVVQTLTQDK